MIEHTTHMYGPISKRVVDRETKTRERGCVNENIERTIKLICGTLGTRKRCVSRVNEIRSNKSYYFFQDVIMQFIIDNRSSYIAGRSKKYQLLVLHSKFRITNGEYFPSELSYSQDYYDYPNNDELFLPSYIPLPPSFLESFHHNFSLIATI